MRAVLDDDAGSVLDSDATEGMHEEVDAAEVGFDAISGAVHSDRGLCTSGSKKKKRGKMRVILLG